MFSVEMPNSRVAAGGSKDFRCLTFPYKLWQLLNDCNDGAIRWSVDGIYILVNQSKFINSPSVQTVFKKVQWKSFVRQLNMYGFHKVSPVQQPCHKNHDSDFCTCHFAVGSVFYQHEHLRRWDFESLTRVTRQRKPNNLTKKENPNDLNGNETCDEFPTQVSELEPKIELQELVWNAATVPTDMQMNVAQDSSSSAISPGKRFSFPKWMEDGPFYSVTDDVTDTQHINVTQIEMSSPVKVENIFEHQQGSTWTTMTTMGADQNHNQSFDGECMDPRVAFSRLDEPCNYGVPLLEVELVKSYEAVDELMDVDFQVEF